MLNKLMVNSIARLLMGGVSYYLVSKGFDQGLVDNLNTAVTSLIGGTAVAGLAIAWSSKDKKAIVQNAEKVTFDQPAIKPPKGYSLSQRSLGILNGVDRKLTELFTTAIIDSPHDFTIYHGIRTDEEQVEMLRTGASRVKHSKHQDGQAVDIFIIGKDGKPDWLDIQAYTEVSDHVKECSRRLNIPIKWGGDWTDFKDYVHYELI